MTIHNLYIAILLALAATVPASAGTLSFEASSTGRKVLHYDAPATSGLTAGVYVADVMSGVTATYNASNEYATVTWYRFSNLGGGYA